MPDNNRIVVNSTQIKANAQDLLSNYLEQGNEAQRCFSASAVAQAKMLSAVPALTQGLYHEDPDVVIDCANALEKLPGAGARELEEVARFHPEGDARLSALKALWFCAQNLSEQQNKNDSYRKIRYLFSEFALGRPSDESFELSGDWDDWWDLQLYAVTCLLQDIQTDDLQLFSDLLADDPEPELLKLLCQGMAKLAPEQLISLYADKPSNIRRQIVKALALAPSQSAPLVCEFLLQQLLSNDVIVRALSIESLSNFMDNNISHEILMRACDPSAEVRAAAFTAMLRSQYQFSFELLLALINGSDDLTTTFYLRLFAQIGTPINTQQQAELALLGENLETQSLLSLVELLDVELLESIHRESLLLGLLEQLKPDLSSEIMSQILRQVRRFPAHEEHSLPSLKHIIEERSNDREGPLFESSVRLAAIEALVDIDGSRHLKKLVLGELANDEAIAVTVIEPSVDEQTDSPDTTLESQLEARTQSTGEYQALTTVPLSTLAAIEQISVEQNLKIEQQPQVSSQDHIMGLANQLDDSLQDYVDIVQGNFDSADNLDLNRKKKARLPEFDNQILAVRALASGNNEANQLLLIEALLGASPVLHREILTSLTQLCSTKQGRKVASNAIGSAGNAMHHGDVLSKQAAAQLLSYMPRSKAIPLLLFAVNDSNAHVRLACLVALQSHIGKSGMQSYVEGLSSILQRRLVDSETGVRKAAFSLFAKLGIDSLSVEIQEQMLKAAIENDECYVLATSAFEPIALWALMNLTQSLPELEAESEKRAIALIGSLLKYS
ncbi:HEAT repeat domain-containing protein [Alginatibacterium sediminis]|uniref:HEAT repeat domain-containing protein n=1 Tax=Alginatibacterium sediminis TaxID=2164068 RepID=A0A420ELI7_9ALTE|nr:HEAT repeat domain-containing protein [Alginatibacterium sediminis]RKF21466.1 HEAT repeat domain-containing protein [Alginatibacterium sediminis]